MFGWLKKRSGASFVVSDTERTLNEVRKLTDVVQRVIATSVYNEIVRSLREIDSTPGPNSLERDEVIRDQLVRAKAARHRALNRGAKSWADPDWAAAAIFESWLMANSGALGRKAFDKIADLIMAWLRSVLRNSDIDEIERS